jgi:hypothetical protein
MARPTTTTGRYIVSGPGVEEKAFDDLGPAVSAATSKAERSTEPSTFYVHDSFDENDLVVARAEHDEHGRTFIYSKPVKKAAA